MARKSPDAVDEITRAVEQVCSSAYTYMFEKVVKEQPYNLTHEQYTLLSYYPNEITWYRGDQSHEIIERIRRKHLIWFIAWLQKQDINLYQEWNFIMDDLMLHIINLFFRIDLGDVVTSDQTRNAFYQVTDTIKHILSGIVQSASDVINPSARPTVQILLLILFYFTWDDDLVIYLKSLKLIQFIMELIRMSKDDHEIQLQAYRILAVIMTEADLEGQRNSQRIVAVFITFITEGIDGSIPYEARLHHSLRSLRGDLVSFHNSISLSFYLVLTQHDQIREELIKQQGYSLFLRCVLEQRFNLLKAKLPALEILLVLAFNDIFADTLRENDTFMDSIRMLTSSPHRDVRRVATALIWQLTKTQEHRSFSTSLVRPGKKLYDIIISYSHSDNELSHRLFDTLEKDQLQVWIDSRPTHSVNFDVMAKAIENAEFVLICMSDAYKQNPCCEMEASYAVKRQCRIIPIVMTPSYKADGWLAVLTTELIHIDYPTLGFDRAYQEVKKQIELYRMNGAASIIDMAAKSIPCTGNTNEPVG